MEEVPSTDTPLLRNGSADGDSPRPNRVVSIISRASGRRGSSRLVHEAAMMHLEERRVDWGHSKPVVAVDIFWNFSFTVASVIILSLTVNEKPNTPIRVWICGYALQCIVHAILVWLEYRRRERRRRNREERRSSNSDENESEEGEVGGNSLGQRGSFEKHCESVNTMASFLWWLVGFYWVVSGGQVLLENAPRLYWLAVVFLAFDVLFAILCVALACIIGIALCCCLPCIIALLYAVVGQEGASDADLRILPRYRYCQGLSNGIKSNSGDGAMVPIITSDGNATTEQSLPPEDAECCICITPYEDGAEINALPCNHHFHSSCIVKWLRINATCPLCKYNILKGNDQV